MFSEFRILALVTFCLLANAESNIDDSSRTVLQESKRMKYLNELRDRKIAELERNMNNDRNKYEIKFAQQERVIARLELIANKQNKQDVHSGSICDKVNASDIHSNGLTRHARQLLGSPGPAFTAYLSQHASNLGHQHTIPFDSVILNEGQAFNTNTHEFTCPISGVYTFQTALLSQNNAIAITEIVKEGVQLVQAHAEARSSGTNFDQGFNSVVTKCNKGESVWVRNYQHFGSTVYSERYTTFTGFLLWEIEEPSPDVIG